MEKNKVLNIIQSMPKARKIVDEGEKISFVYDNFLNVDFNLEHEYVIISGVIYKLKLFRGGTVAKVYQGWVSTYIEYNSATLFKGLKPTNVGEAHAFSIFFNEELVDMLPDMLEGFINDFLPTIRQFIKGDYYTIADQD